tara:strand:+ start:7249 stop:8022 length:774 start_codon:yes stop_codon:yes gene_type:complete
MLGIGNGIGTPFLFSPAGGGGGGGVVTDNLLIYVDASNPASYGGSGTTWTDLEGNYNGTLTNGPTYSSADGGQIVLDGTDDWVTFGNVTEQAEASAFSMQMWFRMENASSNNRLWGRRRNSDNKIISGWVHANGSLYFSNANNAANQVGFKSGLSFTDNEWYNVAWVFDGSGGSDADRAKIYLDGVQQTGMTFNAGGVPTTTFNFPSYEQFVIGADRTNFSNQRLEGGIGEFMEYTSAISADDVLANFDVTKTRYGK